MSNRKFVIFSFIIAFLIVTAIFYVDCTASALSVIPHPGF